MSFCPILSAVDHADNQEYPHLGAIVQEFAQNRPDQVAEMVNTGGVDVKELVEVAPFVRASDLVGKEKEASVPVFGHHSIGTVRIPLLSIG
ncbi:hypothetical protein [Paenibacillus sp. MMS20-IR301]|uniref:hypothetical protein n=1 Tax=Paenibacillus sp. MMS20-IR301 TaxID=2895946 RepID=UPI0028EEA70B|nr:hypothetical protein [Paenibacillus sp. MMS20-IR301]WNS43094.1 hypothetical protein LOS79_29810 [Paenibacillus sp. MMS20-IR301]